VTAAEMASPAILFAELKVEKALAIAHGYFGSIRYVSSPFLIFFEEVPYSPFWN
jgi:hypothetical protein